MSLLKLLALLFLGSLTVLGNGETISSAPKPIPSSTGCHEHRAPAQTPQPVSQQHECCSAGHNPALPTQRSSRTCSLNVNSCPIAVARSLRPELIKNLVARVNRSETPPPPAPIRI